MNTILWTKETENYKSSLYSNFRSSLSSYLNCDLVNIENSNQIDSCKNLIIIDEHFAPHKELITNSNFIKLLNKKNVKVIIFNFEKIYNSFWPHNLITQKKISKINNMIQILSDVDDITLLGSPFPNKQFLSKSLKFSLNNEVKKNEVLFYGQLKGLAYENRRQVLEKFSDSVQIPLQIIESSRMLEYTEYLDLISKYKYILNPLGAGSFVNIRYFETLLVNSIPVQQFTNNMLDAYRELQIGQSINFLTTESLKGINFGSFTAADSKLYLEDYFYKNKLISFLD
jgi:hypothetical protein